VNRQIARLGTVLLVCYAALFVQLNRVQVFGAQALNDNPVNSRAVQGDYDRARGTISTADGVIVAQSDMVEGRFEHLRRYPEGDLYSHTVGHLSFAFGSTGVERVYHDQLAGTADSQEFREVSDLFIERDTTADVTLTLRHDVQQAARSALAATGGTGSVVAVDPRSGAILAFWSAPSYDPNPLSGHDLDLARADWNALNADPDKPSQAKMYQERFFPGSTFKVITAAAALELDRVSPTEPVIEPANQYVPPASTRPIRNFGGSTCGGDLIELLRVSCNTGFAQIGAELVGPEVLVATAERFGFNDRVPIDLPAPARSNMPTDYGDRLSGDGGPGTVYENSARLAQVAIGQNDVSATPLQMAMVASAIANDGLLREPRVVAEIRDAEGQLLESNAGGATWRRAISAATSDVLRQAMIGVVDNGTASRLAVEGFEVGGKTGTAQIGSDPPTSHAWIIGFAGPSGGPAEVAVAVLVEAQNGVSEQTGGTVAAPVARAVLEAALLGSGAG